MMLFMFASTNPPAIVTEASAHIGPDVVAALAGIDAAETVNLACIGALIGHLKTTLGDAESVRADRFRVEPEPGMLMKAHSLLLEKQALRMLLVQMC